MKSTRWNLLKNETLKKERGISFEDILNGQLIAVKKHPNKKNQKLMLFKLKDYIWVVPFVESKNELFLKTAFPSRKYTKIFNQEKLI